MDRIVLNTASGSETTTTLIAEGHSMTYLEIKKIGSYAMAAFTPNQLDELIEALQLRREGIKAANAY
jgi:hypothetical protein